MRSRGLEEVVILNVDTNLLETPFDDLKRTPSDVVINTTVLLGFFFLVSCSSHHFVFFNGESLTVLNPFFKQGYIAEKFELWMIWQKFYIKNLSEIIMIRYTDIKINLIYFFRY